MAWLGQLFGWRIIPLQRKEIGHLLNVPLHSLSHQVVTLSPYLTIPSLYFVTWYLFVHVYFNWQTWTLMLLRFGLE